MSAVQKASRLGRPGGVGTRGARLEGDLSFDGERGGDGGGVEGRSSTSRMTGFLRRGGEGRMMAS